MLNSRDIDRLRPDVAANCRAWLELCRSHAVPQLSRRAGRTGLRLLPEHQGTGVFGCLVLSAGRRAGGAGGL